MKALAHKKINSTIAIAGSPHYPAYIVKGAEKNLMIEAGINLFGPLYLKHLREILVNEERLDYLFVTHSHYDHLGAAQYLKKKIPGLALGGYGRINSVIAKQNVIDKMNGMSRHQTGMYKEIIDCPAEELDLTPFALDIELNDGDEFDLGGVTCRVLFTPGHTRDSLSFYIPELNAVFPGECAGVPEADGNGVQVVFLTSFEDYVESTKKIIALKPDIIGMAHGWVFTGADAEEYLQKSLSAAYEYRDLILNYISGASGNYEQAMSDIVRIEYDEKKRIHQERNAYLANLSAQVKLLMPDAAV